MPNNRPHVTLSFVISVDGKITFANNPNIHTWTSKEDKRHFAKLIKDHSVIIITSKTYETIKEDIKHTAGKYRIVTTRNPKKYQNKTIPGQLEFTSKSPKQIIKDLTKKGIQKILLASGSIFAHKFLKAKLVDSLVLTIEPKIFGTGTPLVAPLPLNIDLKLKSIMRLNKKGTILLEYEIE